MSFLNGLSKGLGVVEGVLPFVNNTVMSVESLLGGAPGPTKKAAAMQIIGSGLSVAGAVTGAPAEAVAAALNAVSPLIDSVVTLKNLFGEFANPGSPAGTKTAPAAAPASVPANAKTAIAGDPAATPANAKSAFAGDPGVAAAGKTAAASGK
jgi:hypothetical protein